MIRRLLFAVLLTSAAVSMMAQPADSLTGLWSSAWSFDPQLPRRVARDAKRRAVDGDDLRRHDIFRRQREEIWFAFGKRGAFRRRVEQNHISGFWLQPPGVTASAPNASGASQAFASPVVLRRIAGGVWRGDVDPLEERFTLYLHNFAGPDGSLLGAFRNPEQGIERRRDAVQGHARWRCRFVQRR